MGKPIDITGQKFGRLTAVKPVGKTKANKVLWLCKCDCGNEITTITSHLRCGHTQSCGCYSRERSKEANTTHGMKNTRIYNIWCDMKKRCDNTHHWAYDYYGGRGITVCNEWENDFTSFYEWSMQNGYKDDLSIDRIDVNGNYCPDNCRWATRKEQMNNTRANHIIDVDGRTATIAEWAEILHIPRHRLDDAYKRGKSLKEYIKSKLQTN